MRKIFGWIKYALLLTVAAGMAGMLVALAKNLAPWLAFCPLAYSGLRLALRHGAQP